MKKTHLKKMTIKELKILADKMKIEYNTKLKKDELIELLLPKFDDNSQYKNEVILSKDPLEQKQEEKENEELPKNYGRNKLIMLIIDPFKGYLYWEINDGLLKYHHIYDTTVVKYIRIHDMTSDNTVIGVNSEYYEIEVSQEASNCYITFKKPNHKYVAELGFYKKKKFITLLTSNLVTVPRNEVAEESVGDVLDNQDHSRLLFEASGAQELFEHDGSQELMKFLASNVESSYSSSGLNQ